MIFLNNSYFYSKQILTTIYALATGVSSAISIVRISGPQSLKCLTLLEKMQQKNIIQKHQITDRKMHLKKIYGSNGIIDQGLIVYFKKQNSFTGQDMIQFHLHGSKAITNVLFHELQRLQIYPAKRGQFSRRAVINNKISIHQAQAINDLVNSEQQFERQVSIQNLLGKNQKYLSQLREKIIEVICLVEAAIQFQEFQVGDIKIHQIKNKIKLISKNIQDVINSSKYFRQKKQGVKISIVGRPNVGKSTLMNRLLKKQVSIVSNKPGTTRDLIQNDLKINSFNVKLVDTAGIRISDCQIQQQGIKRSKKSMSQSKIIIFVIDINSCKLIKTNKGFIVELLDEQLQLLGQNQGILVFNKFDKLDKEYKDKQFFINNHKNQLENINLLVSLIDQNSDRILLKQIEKKLKQKYHLFSGLSSQIYFTQTRYLFSLQKCLCLLQQCQSGKHLDIISVYLRQSKQQINQIIGKVIDEDVLDKIFSTFCIGK